MIDAAAVSTFRKIVAEAPLHTLPAATVFVTAEPIAAMVIASTLLTTVLTAFCRVRAISLPAYTDRLTFSSDRNDASPHFDTAASAARPDTGVSNGYVEPGATADTARVFRIGSEIS
jgi:hypothetical protein